ncbi:MarR family winged helix-turn-helix transcriptional regulator [Roseibium sediminicola]|uniref:MarR family transcriptional regulator n=1 Tax=Roseibium sediminicola TaxID=2933272 RepID=A0ABT0GNC1_9HYPH|nr:MarR family transcriptional regulator [Roseibium sp. CAU 1639]MCK7610913.1 MarR family transcriptional regulator [Roseibium sp. CAU 1639]
MEDVVRALGYATLGSRLKRIGEKLQAQTQDLAGELAGTGLPTPHNPVLAALDRQGPLSIGDLAKALGQSQPGITRMINKMKSEGLVSVTSLEQDRRVSTVALTEAGRHLVDHLKATLWPAVSFAVADACAGLDGPLLQQLDQLEAALTEQSLSTRQTGQPLPDWDTLDLETRS